VEPGTSERRGLVSLLVFIGLLVAVVSSLGAPLIPGIAAHDHVTLGTAEWVLTAALLTGALATPLLGRLADGPHQRRVVVITLLTVLAGCVLSAIAPTFQILVVGRALQGVGLGVLPVNMAIARRLLPPGAAGRAIATLSVSTAIGAGLGYPLTAGVAQLFGVRAAYWYGGAVVVVALVWAWTTLPPRTSAHRRSFDGTGALLLSCGVAGVVIWLSEVVGWGLTSMASVGLATLSVVMLTLWVRHELTTPHPLVELRHLRNRAVLTADVTGFLMSMAMYLVIPVLVEFIQIPVSTGYGFGASVVVSGFVLMPLSAGTLVASRLVGRVEQWLGMRALIPLGGGLFCVGAASFGLVHRSLWEAFATMGLVGLGVGFTFAALPGLIIRSVPHRETGSATGLYQLLRNVGLSTGSALSTAILRSSTPAGHLLPDLGGFQIAMLVAAGMCIAAAALSWILPGATLGTSAHTGQTDAARTDAQTAAVMAEEGALEATGAMFVDDTDLESDLESDFEPDLD